MADPTPTPAERLALAVCPFRHPVDGHGMAQCETACLGCRRLSAAHAQELAAILRERYGGSSAIADWLDGLLVEGPA